MRMRFSSATAESVASFAIAIRAENDIGDDELEREAFSCQLQSGDESTVRIEQVLQSNRDPQYMR